jgi:hypothetical protein
VGTKLSFNITFHPQTDSQIERVNGVLNQYLKKICKHQSKRLGQTFIRPSKVLLQFHNTLNDKNVPIKLTLGKETKKPMDLSIPTRQKETMEMVKGHEKLYI